MLKKQIKMGICVRHKDEQFTHSSNYTKGKEYSH